MDKEQFNLWYSIHLHKLHDVVRIWCMEQLNGISRFNCWLGMRRFSSRIIFLGKMMTFYFTLNRN